MVGRIAITLFISSFLWSCDAILEKLDQSNNQEQKPGEGQSEDQKRETALELSPEQSQMVAAIGDKLGLSEAELKLVRDLFMRDHAAIEPMYKLIMDLHSKTLAEYLKEKWILRADADKERADLEAKIDALEEKIIAREASLRTALGDPSTDALTKLSELLQNFTSLAAQKLAVEQQLATALQDAENKQVEIQAHLAEIARLNGVYANREQEIRTQLGLTDNDTSIITAIAGLQAQLSTEQSKLANLKQDLGSLLAVSEPTAQALLNRTKYLLGLTDERGRTLSAIYIASSQHNAGYPEGAAIDLLVNRAVALRVLGIYGTEDQVKRDITHAARWKVNHASPETPAFAQNEISPNVFTGLSKTDIETNVIQATVQIESTTFSNSHPVRVISGYSTSYTITHRSVVDDSLIDSPIAKGLISRLEVIAVVSDDVGNTVGRFDVTHGASFQSLNDKAAILADTLNRRGLFKAQEEGTAQFVVSIDGRALAKSVNIGPRAPLGYVFLRGEAPQFSDDIDCGLFTQSESIPYGGSYYNGVRLVGGRVIPDLNIFYTDCTLENQDHVVDYSASTPLASSSDQYDQPILISSRAGEDMAIEFTHPAQDSLPRLNSYSITVAARELTNAFILVNGDNYEDNYWGNDHCYEIVDGDVVSDSNGAEAPDQWDTLTRVHFGLVFEWNGCIRKYVSVTDQGLPPSISSFVLLDEQTQAPVSESLGSFGTEYKALTYTLAIDRGQQDTWVLPKVDYDFSQLCYSADSVCLSTAAGSKTSVYSSRLEGTEAYSLGFSEALPAKCYAPMMAEAPDNRADLVVREAVTFAVEYSADESIYDAETGEFSCHISTVNPDRATVISGGSYATVVIDGGNVVITPSENNRGGILEIELVATPGNAQTIRRTIRVHVGDYGDFNNDGSVDDTDFAMFQQVFGSVKGDGRYDHIYDYELDGAIGISDFGYFRAVYGR